MSTPITHIVLFRYTPTIPWQDLNAHFALFASLRTKCLRNGKPYMQSLRMGANTSWEPFAKGMTHAFILEFASQDDLNYYLLDDAVHLEFSRIAREKGLIEDSVVVDIRDGVLLSAPAPHPLSESASARKGTCHCEAMVWFARLDDASHILCHCSTCQKLSGGPYSLNQIISKRDLAITMGEPRVYTYKGASGKDVRCYFCGTCTSHIYHEQDALPGKVIVRTLLLENGKDLPASGEIFGQGRLKWVQDLKRALETPSTSDIGT